MDCQVRRGSRHWGGGDSLGDHDHGLGLGVAMGREGFCNIVRATLTEQDVKEKRKNAEVAKCSGLTSRTHRSMSMEPGEKGAGAHTGVDSIPPSHVHLEPQNVTLWGMRVCTDGITFLNQAGP